MGQHESTPGDQRLHELHGAAFGQLVATLTRVTGDLSLAEDAVQDAFTKALASWTADNSPDSPLAWLSRTARNAAIDRLRRDRLHACRLPELEHMTLLESTDRKPVTDLHPALRDDMLRLLFTCCHPALGIEARVALSLRTICGLQTGEIASAFIVPESTMAQRLVRAKQKIRVAGIAYRIPDDDELGERLGGVLAVVYLIFNEAYLATRGEGGMRLPLADEAIRLGRTLCTALPENSEVQALLALMLLQHSRRHARFDPDGALVLLHNQDRSLWDANDIAEGKALIHGVFDTGAGHSRYAIQAAIAALHADSGSPRQTDWAEICRLYEYLMALDPSPVIALNHAVAVAERDGPDAGLCLLDQLRESRTLLRYYLYHAARAELLQRCNRFEEAAAAYRLALDRVGNDAERDFLRTQLERVASS